MNDDLFMPQTLYSLPQVQTLIPPHNDADEKMFLPWIIGLFVDIFLACKG